MEENSFTGILLLIWLIFCFVYPPLWLRRYFLDKKDTFEKYIMPDLLSYEFILESSIFIKGKTPEPIFGYITRLHPASGGMRMVTSDGYKIYRTVTVKDKLGKVHQLLAAIEFDDRSPFRRFKKVIWTPELSTLIDGGKSNTQQNQPRRSLRSRLMIWPDQYE